MKRLPLLFLLLLLVTCTTACLPEELSDAQLAGYCKLPGDCASYPEFACYQATCSAQNQCVKGDFKGPGAPCHTSACATDCFCSGPANKAVSIGSCVKGK